MTRHMNDADLIRFLDGAHETAARSEIERHVAECSECRAHLDELRTLSARLSATLREGDVPLPRLAPPTRYRWVPMPAMAAAALVVVLVGLVATVQPVRAWIVERSREVWTLVTGRAGPTPSGTEHSSIDSGGAASVTFRPTKSTLVVRIDSYQLSGTLTIETANVSTVTAAVVGGREDEHLIILPDGFRVTNAATSRASYRLTASERLEEIVVEVGSDVVARFRPGPGQSSRTVDLVRPPVP